MAQSNTVRKENYVFGEVATCRDLKNCLQPLVVHGLEGDGAESVIELLSTLPLDVTKYYTQLL